MFAKQMCCIQTKMYRLYRKMTINGHCFKWSFFFYKNLCNFVWIQMVTFLYNLYIFVWIQYFWSPLLNCLTVKILINAHALINANPPICAWKSAICFTFFSEISATYKCQMVNLEKILLLSHAVSFWIYCLIIEQTSPVFSLGPHKRYEHGFLVLCQVLWFS